MMNNRAMVEKALNGEARRGQLLTILPDDFGAAAGEFLDLADRGLRTFSFMTEDREKSRQAREDADQVRVILERWGKP